MWSLMISFPGSRKSPQRMLQERLQSSIEEYSAHEMWLLN